MSKWQSYSALKRVKHEVEALTGAVVNALEDFLSTPAGDERPFDILKQPVAGFAGVPGVLQLLECHDLALLTRELAFVLEDTLARQRQLTEEGFDERLQQAFMVSTIFPSLFDDALANGADRDEHILPLLNRLRLSRGAALVLNRQVPASKPEANFRRQSEQHPERFLDAVTKQVVYCGKACRRLKDNTGNNQALQVLQKAVANIGLLLRDFNLGTSWALANSLVTTASAENRLQPCIKVLALLAHTLLLRCREGVAQLDVPCEAEIMETLHNQLQAFREGQEADNEHPAVLRLFLEHGNDLTGRWQEELAARQVRYFSHSSRSKALELLEDDINNLIETINQVVARTPISDGKLVDIQNGSIRLHQVLEFLGYRTEKFPIVFSPDGKSSSQDGEKLLELAKALFTVSHALDGKLANLELVVFSEVPAESRDLGSGAARLHAFQGAMQSLESAIRDLDLSLEQGSQAMQDASVRLDELARVMTMMSLPTESEQVALARDYLDCLVSRDIHSSQDGGFQTLCHLLINTLWSLEQHTLGREKDSAFYRKQSAAYSESLATCLKQLLTDEKQIDEVAGTVDETGHDIPVLQPESATASGEDNKEIRKIFLQEFDGIMDSLQQALAGLRTDSDQAHLIRDCSRYFHTLKGSGKMVGVDLLYDLGLVMEKLFNALGRQQNSIREPVLAFSQRVLEELTGLKAGLMQVEINEQAQSAIGILCEEAASLIEDDTSQDNDRAPNPVISGFLQEAGELVSELVLAQQHWCQGTETAEREESQTRTGHLLHLLQGAANAAGLTAVRELFSAMAILYDGIDTSESLPVSLKAVMNDCTEYLNELLRGVERGRGPGYSEALLQVIACEINWLESPIEQPETGNSGIADENTAAITAENAGKGPDDAEMAETIAAELPVIASSGTVGEEEAKQVDEDTDDSDESIDQSLIQVFLEEAQELLQHLDDLYLRWQDNSGDREVLGEYLRILHTLKGSAALVQDQALSTAAHDFESFVLQAKHQGQNFGEEFFASCDSRMLGLQELCSLYVRDSEGRITRRVEADKAPLSAEPAEEKTIDPEPIPEDLKPVPLLLPVQDSPAKETTPQSAGETNPEEAQEEPEDAENAAGAIAGRKQNVNEGSKISSGNSEVRDEQESAEDQVRVSSRLLSYLLNEADEINFSRNRMEQSFHNIGGLLLEMDEKFTRLKNYVKRFEETASHQSHQARTGEGRISDEFDALEMDRYTELQEMSLSLSEDYEDLQDIRQNLAGRLREIDSVLTGQRRLTNSLQDGLITSQMLPFASIVPRLRRLIRQVSRELKKQVRLEIENQQGNLDKNVLQAIITPFEHLLRNALDHGIESPEERSKAGKEKQAVIAIKVARQGAGIEIELKDDGRGIDVEKVKQRARDRGLLAADAKISDSTACQLLFQPGFSTADTVSTISGRGVGLDVVKTEITQIGGSVDVHTKKGRGTSFFLHLPLTSSLNRALLFQIQERPYVVLMNTLDGILVEKLSTVIRKQQGNEQPVFEYGNKMYEYLYLGKLINPDLVPKPDIIENSVQLLLVSGRHRNFALHIDSIIESRDLVVKSFGRQFSNMPGIGGGVIMPDGNVAIVLDLPSLANLYSEDGEAGIEKLLTMDGKEAEGPGEKTVMVVDDSITVRKITAKILERNGLKVITAKDGMEALELLAQHVPDVILLDIEMPRMDGFEVATHIRKQPPPVRDIPIIMITSRIGEKHRSRAEKIGVNEYLCKPFQEENLLAHIHSF